MSIVTGLVAVVLAVVASWEPRHHG